MIQPKFKSELLDAVEKLVEDVADFDERYATVCVFVLFISVSNAACYSVSFQYVF